MTWMPTFYGLLAALTWGAGDFFGGVATKQVNAIGVVIFSHLISMGLLIGTIIVMGDPLPQLQVWFWGGAAGLGGAFGLLLLYDALSSGKMAVAAPTSALVAAILPVLISIFSNGLPGINLLFGLLLALISIWFLSGGNNLMPSISELKLPVLAGVAFSFFFLCLHQASSSSLLYPLIAVRVTSISSLVLYAILGKKTNLIPSAVSFGPIILSGILDTVGNGAFALSSQLGRVDIASVLGSLYPGSTVFLAWLFLHEKLTKIQIFGICLALIACVIIS